jgi:hypothetical protein
MPDRAYGRLAFRLTVLKLLRSPAIIGASLSLPALVVFVWARESYEAGLRTFLFLLPHVFLVATQNMFRGEAVGGALENVLFIRGGFRRYFLWKNAVLSLVGSGYGLLVFALIRVFGPGVPEAGPGELHGLAASLLAGVYFVAFGGLLGHFLEGGSNVLVLIFAQAAAFIGLIHDAAGGHHFLESLASGTFSGPGEGLKFLALAGVLPNILVAGPLRRHAPWMVPAAAALFLFQALIVRGAEVRGR